MKRYLITGSNGLLGQKLIEQLSAQSEVEIHATGRGPNRLKNDDFTYYSVDLTQQHEVQKLVENVAPDVLIHGAAMTQVDYCETHREECRAANVDATKYLLEACSPETHFIFISTDFIFDGSHGPLTEEENPNPLNYYGKSKLEAEELVRKIPKWSIVRTILVYGVAQDMSRSNIVLWVKRSLEQEKAIRVVNDQWRTPTLAEDLASGTLLVAEKQATGVFNISGDELMTPYDIAMNTANHFKLNKALISPADAHSFKETAQRPPKTGFDISKARKILGYESHSFSEGLQLVDQQLQ